ncbi:MAG: hypothetical protein HRT46_01465 [Deltaproteobacteria bacterium]|nr:hypothetical protein [Deltaproteobacteria bacterium]
MSPQSDKTSGGPLSAAMLRLLKPLVRLLLRKGMPYGAFADLAKRVYVDTARDEFAIEGRKQTTSRVSILTGLSRKEVSRVSALPDPDDQGASDRYNRAARVISGWVRDQRFANELGDPALLPLEGDEQLSFSQLVKIYSGDVPVRALLDELQRIGAVEADGKGNVRLLARAYVPGGGDADKLAILGMDVADLVSTIDHNMQCEADDLFFQRKVSYDNMPLDPDRELRKLAAERAQTLLEELDHWMSARDRDASPGVEGRGRMRASLGVYYYEEELPEETTADTAKDEEEPS